MTLHTLKALEKDFILINKSSGITSFRVVARLRRKYFPGQKVGHTGTLDSMASGLLIILVGKATKRQAELTKLSKEYEGEFALGVESDTYSADGYLRFPFWESAPEGNMLPEKAIEKSARQARTLHELEDMRGKLARYKNILVKQLSLIKREQIEDVFRKFKGEYEQTVPPFSAVQVNGKRLYKLARGGRPLPELPKRKVRIERLELLEFHPIAQKGLHSLEELMVEELLRIAPRVKFRAHVSSGTYIRSLVYDIGKDLSIGAVLTQLVRTGIGPYKLSDAIDLLAVNTPLEKETRL